MARKMKVVEEINPAGGAKSSSPSSKKNTETKVTRADIISGIDRSRSKKSNTQSQLNDNHDNYIIDKYESIPNYNVFQRMLDASKADAYKEKQEMHDSYIKAQERVAKRIMANKKITKSDLENAYINASADDWKTGEKDALKESFKQKGVTDEQNELLKEYIKRQSMKNTVQDMYAMADKNGVLGTLGTILAKPMGSVYSAIGNAGSYLTGKPIDSEGKMNVVGNATDAMREASSKDLGKVGKFAYDTGMAIADNAPIYATMGIAKAVPSIVSGVIGFGESTKEAAARGLTPGKVMTTGITNAAVEAAFEKIPVEGMAKILSKHGKEAKQSLVKAIAGQMGSEAFEEAGTEFVNTLADRVINGAQSNIMLAKQAYMASGMSEEEATRQARIDVAKNVGYSGLTGAVSGGVMGAGASLASRLGRNTTTTTPAEELQKLDPLNATGMNTPNTEVKTEDVAEPTPDTKVNEVANIEEVGKESQEYQEIFKGAYHVPSAPGNSSPLANARDVHENSSFENNIPNSAENVNVEGAKTINGFPELNKNLDMLVGMYKGNENTQALYSQMKAAVNEYVQTGKQEAIDRAVTLAAEIDDSLVGHSYTRKGSGKNSTKSQNNRITTTYTEGEFTETFMAYWNDLRTIAKENAAKVSVPNSTQKVSQARTNTFANSGMFTEEEGKKYHALDNFTFESTNEEETVAAARDNLNRHGKKYVDDLLVKEKPLTASEIDALMLEYKRVSKEARNSNEETVWGMADDLLKRVQTESSRNGQALQALAKWSRNTPEGQLAQAMTEVEKVNKKAYGKGRIEAAEDKADKVHKAYKQVKSALEDVEIKVVGQMKLDLGDEKVAKSKAKLDSVLEKMQVKNWEQLSLELCNTPDANRNTVIDLLKKYEAIDPKIADAITNDYATQHEVLELLNQAYSMDMDSRAAKVLMAHAGKLISQKMSHTLPGKTKQFLYNQMLGNFRTLVSRNAGGNIGVALMEQLRQPLAATIDRAVSKKTGFRTTTGWSKEKQSAYVKGAIKGISDEFADFKETVKAYKDKDNRGLHTAKDGENTLINAIKNNDSAFDGKGLVSKVLNFQNDLVKHGLSFGDRPFYEAAKAQAEVELRTLVNKQMGIDTKGLKLDEFIEMAAKQIALEAVYQGDTEISKGLMSIRNGLAEVSKGTVGADVLTQTTAPFVKSPANVLDMSIEYSPFGVIKNAAKTISEKRTGQFDQRRFVDETSRNILGIALFSACVGAFSHGLLSGKYDEDKDMKNAQKQAGIQEYALHLGDTYMDLGWLPVVGGSVEAGAAAGDAYRSAVNEGANKGAAVLSAGLHGLSQVPQSVFDQSMFTGLQDLMGNMYSSDDPFISRAANSVASGLIGQSAGSLPRQIAQSIDSYERELGKYGTAEYYGNSFVNSLPFVRESLPIKHDTSGNEVMSNQGRNMASRLFENLLLPGKITTVKEDPANNEAMKLYESTGKKGGFLRTSEWKYDSDGDGNKERLTAEQHSQHQQITGINSSLMISYLMELPVYDIVLDDNRKVEAISSITEFAEKLARSEVMGYDVANAKSYKKLYSIYQNMGADGVAIYIAANKILEGTSNADYVKAIDHFDLSEEDKGYYLEKLIGELSKEALAALDEEGHAGVYRLYSEKAATARIKAMREQSAADRIKALRSTNNSYNDAAERIRALRNKP